MADCMTLYQNYEMQRRFFNILIAIDQLANAVIGGMPDETISARCWRKERRWAIWLIDRIFRERDADGNFNHCQASYDHEMARMDLPEEYRAGVKQ